MNNINVNSNGLKKWGILDPIGKYPNPLTGETYQNFYKNINNRPGTYEEYASKWSKLPVYSKRNEFIKTISENQVILVESGTGSGKTVLVPKFALHSSDYKANIAVTIPKQIIVKSSAIFAAKCLDVKIGKEVGYKYRGSPSDARSADTKLLFTTDGTIVAQLLNDPLIPQYDMVIIDEAHERNIQIDFLLLLLKETLKKRADLKLIIMSATINIDLFVNYFPKKEFKFAHLDAGSGTTFPIEDIFLSKSLGTNDKAILQKSVETAADIIKKADNDGDILVFVNHKGEGNDGCQMLDQLLKNTNKNKINPYCGILASGVSKEDEKYATDVNTYKTLKNSGGKDYTIKVIFATNVAESSLTVEGVKYVIDNGFELLESYEPNKMMQQLNRSRISNAQRKQRRGRGGRTAPGVCYYMYTKKECDELREYPLPAIKKSDLSSDVLRFLSLGNVNTIKELLSLLNSLIEPPDMDFVNSALKILMALNIIEVKDNKSGELTELGKKVSRFGSGMSPMAAISLFYGYENYVKTEVAIIVSMLEACDGKINSIFTKFSFDKRSNSNKEEQHKKYLKTKKKFSHKYGDFMTFLNIYKAYEDFKNNKSINMSENKWCKENFLKAKTLSKVKNDYKRLLGQFMRSIRENKILDREEDPNKEDLKNIKQNGGYQKDEIKILNALMKGYIVSFGKPQSGKYFYNCFPKLITNAELDRESFVLLEKTKPKYMFYESLQEFNGMVRFNIISKVPLEVYNNLDEKQKDIINLCSKKIKSVHRPKQVKKFKKKKPSKMKKKKHFGSKKWKKR